MENLLGQLERLHTTELGKERIRKNLSLQTEDVVGWCREKIAQKDAKILREGKNWYIIVDHCEITVNAYSYTIITAYPLNDNTTPHSAKEYDKKIEATIPYLREFYAQTLDLAEQFGHLDGSWLDLGCGTGLLEESIIKEFPDMKITALDPSEEMLSKAKDKFVGGNIRYICGKSTDICFQEEFDVITAIQSHHYMKEEERELATRKVYDALKKDGLYISFENVVPEDEVIKKMELLRWGRYQIRNGKTKEEALAHNQRCGVNYFPITVREHIELLKKTGFQYVNVFWKSYMQMGIYAVKEQTI